MELTRRELLKVFGCTAGEGVLSNSERRYHLVEKLVDPPGEARSDLDILVAFADRLSHGDVIGG